MRASELKRLHKKYLQQHLPQWEFTRDLLFDPDIGFLLRAFCFERSGDPRSFYLTRFVQPLYIPREYVTFTFGERLGSWDITKDGSNEFVVMAEVLRAIREKGIPILEVVRSPRDLMKLIATPYSHIRDEPVVSATMAYSCLLEGEPVRAQEELRRLERIVARCDPDLEWPRRHLQRGRQIGSLLRERGLESAVSQLAEWTRGTIAALGLQTEEPAEHG